MAGFIVCIDETDVGWVGLGVVTSYKDYPGDACVGLDVWSVF